MPLEVRQLVVKSSVVQASPEAGGEACVDGEREAELRQHLAEELRRTLRTARHDRKER